MYLCALAPNSSRYSSKAMCLCFLHSSVLSITILTPPNLYYNLLKISFLLIYILSADNAKIEIRTQERLLYLILSQVPLTAWLSSQND